MVLAMRKREKGGKADAGAVRDKVYGNGKGIGERKRNLDGEGRERERTKHLLPT